MMHLSNDSKIKRSTVSTCCLILDPVNVYMVD